MLILQFAGAADLMLLCDGENCEQAFHSFCLKFPLQTIPEGDWLCPLCLHGMRAKEMSGGIAVKRTAKLTAKLRAKLIPSSKKVEAIIGFREDPSVIENDNQKERKLQYLVKWCSLSHRHATWVCSLGHVLTKCWRLHQSENNVLFDQFECFVASVSGP